MKIKTNILNGRNESGSFVSFGMVDGTQGGYYSPTISDSGELTYRASDDRMPEIEWRNIVGPPATTDKTLSEVGKMADAQVVGEEFTSIDALLKNTKKSDIEIERRLTNLEYALDDYLYRPFTDDTPAYTKTVPDGVLPKATLDSFGGRSIWWNQLINNPELSDGTNWRAEYGSLSYSDGVATYAVKSKNMAARLEQNLSHGLIVGHKYFLRIYVNPSHESKTRVRVGSGSGVQQVILKPDVWSEIYNVRNATEEDAAISIFRVYVATDTEEWNVGDTWKVKSPLVVDLTQMFGAGNEPTADEFNAMFPDDYYPYNDGEIRTAPITAVVTSAGTTIEIPEAVRSLPGYGETGAVVNFETQKYTAPDGTEIDISNIMPNNELQVEADGTIIFENEHKLSVPNQITYLVKTEGG